MYEGEADFAGKNVMDLNTLWFILLSVLLAGYAVLDGFDLGVGILHPGARGDRERRILLNTVGPVWDGNEVWLVAFGGAMFAAFPEVYATVFSAYYPALILILLALIFRAASVEFRSKLEGGRWRALWDVGFSVSSLLASFLFGLAVGSLMKGIPLNERGVFVGTVWDLISLYAVWVGLTVVALFAMHGAVYLLIKTEGELQRRVEGWFWGAFGAFVVCFVVLTVLTWAEMPGVMERFRQQRGLWGLVFWTAGAVGVLPWLVRRGRFGWAFLASGGLIVGLVGLLAVTKFPYLVLSRPEVGNSLDIYNAASSPRTLGIMAVIVAVGMPLVLSYTAVVYWIFRGKVRLEEAVY